MRRVVFVIIVIGLLATFLLAGSDSMSGQWLLKNDYKLDGVLSPTETQTVELNSHHDMFSGHYVGIDNDSDFRGNVHTARKTSVITITITDQDYYWVLCGKKVGNNRFVGTWYDVEGQSGDFELIKR